MKKNSPHDSSTKFFFNSSPYMTFKLALGNPPVVVITVTTFVSPKLPTNVASNESNGSAPLRLYKLKFP
jgi:predicted transposase YdaD